MTVIVNPKDSPKATKFIDEVVTKLGGQITATDDWGERDFVYPISKLTSGQYIHHQLELDNSKISELESRFKREPSILRQLLVKDEVIKKE